MLKKNNHWSSSVPGFSESFPTEAPWFLSLTGEGTMCSSSVIATSSMFWDAFLLTAVVKSGYLSQYKLLFNLEPVCLFSSDLCYRLWQQNWHPLNDFWPFLCSQWCVIPGDQKTGSYSLQNELRTWSESLREHFPYSDMWCETINTTQRFSLQLAQLSELLHLYSYPYLKQNYSRLYIWS